MKAIHLKSHVGADGILNLRVPTGIQDTDLDVIVVSDHDSRTAIGSDDPDRWAEFIRMTAGSISDPTFVCP